MEQTLIEYAAERRDDPWWDEVYQIIHRVIEKTKDSPERPSAVRADGTTEPGDPAASPKACPMKAGRLTRIMCECVVCTKRFPAKRSDAKYCSHRCQLRGHRHGLSFRGPNENIKPFCEA
jgi:hypothetical protein